MIRNFEFYHGTVLAKLIHKSKEPVSIKLYPSLYNGSYILNDSVGIYIKYSEKRMSPWRFSFKKDHQDEILEMKKSLSDVFLILICGDDGFVTLSFAETKKILNESHDITEWISASRTPRSEYTVKGSDGNLGTKISNIDFEDKILSALKKALKVKTEKS